MAPSATSSTEAQPPSSVRSDPTTTPLPTTAHPPRPHRRRRRVYRVVRYIELTVFGDGYILGHRMREDREEGLLVFGTFERCWVEVEWTWS